jgi:acyl carrier protein
MASSENLNEQLEKIFQNVFDNNNLEIKNNTASKDIDDWDSLANIRLFVAIEKNFKIKFDAAEISNLANFGEILELIQKKL